MVRDARDVLSASRIMHHTNAGLRLVWL